MPNINYILWSTFRGWIITILIVQIIFGIITSVYSSSKGYSAGWGFLLGFSIPLFGAIAIIGLLPDKEKYQENERSKTNFAGVNSKKCPFCAEAIKDEALICPHCGNNIREYEERQKILKMEVEDAKAKTISEKYKTLEDIFNDENIMREAKEFRRIYGKSFYISHLKNKAKELGLGDIEINADDVE